MAAGVYGWQTYHLHVPIVLISGSLNFLETSGPVQVCSGIDLSFTALNIEHVTSRIYNLQIPHFTSWSLSPSKEKAYFSLQCCLLECRDLVTFYVLQTSDYIHISIIVLNTQIQQWVLQGSAFGICPLNYLGWQEDICQENWCHVNIKLLWKTTAYWGTDRS